MSRFFACMLPRFRSRVSSRDSQLAALGHGQHAAHGCVRTARVASQAVHQGACGNECVCVSFHRNFVWFSFRLDACVFSPCHAHCALAPSLLSLALHTQIISRLMSLSASLSISNFAGENVAHIVAKSGNIDAACMLFEVRLLSRVRSTGRGACRNLNLPPVTACLCKLTHFLRCCAFSFALYPQGSSCIVSAHHRCSRGDVACFCFRCLRSCYLLSCFQSPGVSSALSFADPTFLFVCASRFIPQCSTRRSSTSATRRDSRRCTWPLRAVAKAWSTLSCSVVRAMRWLGVRS